MKIRVDVVGVVFKLIENKLFILSLNGEYATSEKQLPTTTLSKSIDPEATLTKRLTGLGVKLTYLEQLYTFSDPGVHSIKMAYIAFAEPGGMEDLQISSNEILWAPVKRVPRLSGIHQQIKESAIQRLRNKVSYSRIATRLLPPEFTLTEVMEVYEQILDEPVDKRNFRKKVESKKLVVPTSKFRRGTHRPARLYRQGPKAKNVPL
jgi:8-oxo-dGTP diphosphatase